MSLKKMSKSDTEALVKMVGVFGWSQVLECLADEAAGQETDEMTMTMQSTKTRTLGDIRAALSDAAGEADRLGEGVEL